MTCFGKIGWSRAFLAPEDRADGLFGISCPFRTIRAMGSRIRLFISASLSALVVGGFAPLASAADPLPVPGSPTETTAPPAPPPTTVDNSEKLEEAEKKLGALRQQIAQTVERYNATLAEKNRVENEIPKVQGKINKLRQELRGRAASIYKSQGKYETLPGENTADELTAARYAYLADKLAQYDLDIAAKLNKEMAKLRSLQEQQKKLLEELDQQKLELDKQLELANAELEQVEANFALVRADGKVCPVNGLVAFTNDWGNPRSGGRTHKGTDIFAARGTPNVAIVSGVAERNLDDLGGIGVWLRGDDGVSYYYAHLDGWNIEASQRVNQGDVIGFTGNSGNASDTPTHTHLQVQPGGGEPVNPYPTLKQLCAANRAL